MIGQSAAAYCDFQQVTGWTLKGILKSQKHDKRESSWIKVEELEKYLVVYLLCYTGSLSQREDRKR